MGIFRCKQSKVRKMKKVEKELPPEQAPESGEEELALLIKEAGESARIRKKKAMDDHFKRLHLAVTGGLCTTLDGKTP
jgi:hypothetical protein